MFFVVFYMNVILHYPVLLLTMPATNYYFDYCLICPLFSEWIVYKISRNCGKTALSDIFKLLILSLQTKTFNLALCNDREKQHILKFMKQESTNSSLFTEQSSWSSKGIFF